MYDEKQNTHKNRHVFLNQTKKKKIIESEKKIIYKREQYNSGNLLYVFVINEIFLSF